MAQSPEKIRHQRGTVGPIAPRGAVGAQAPKGPDAELAALLQELIGITQRNALFGATVAYDWLLSSLTVGGYAFPIMINSELVIGPGATVTVYQVVPPGYTFLMRWMEYWNSLPWWLTAAMWSDTDLPAPPASLFLRAPDHLRLEWSYFFGSTRFTRYTVTNNHAVNPANFIASHFMYAITTDTASMLEKVYLNPIVNFIRAEAERTSGRPYP